MSPPPFFRFPAIARFRPERQTSHTGAGQEVKGDRTATRGLAGLGGGCPEPPGKDSAREANPSQGPTGGVAEERE